MRFTTRVPPPEDSPVPGVIPGKVHVQHEPERDVRPQYEPERPTRPPTPWVRLRRLFGHGARS